MQVEVDADGLDTAIPPEAAQLLYRTAQESLRNVVRHGEAHAARVLLTVNGTAARIEVIDDGRGFDPEEAAARAAEGHVGLRGLAGLIDDAGGRMGVESQPGGGTRVDVEVPLR